MGGPTVSVITPVHNGEEFLAECVRSVLDQTFADWEYLIVDNCSDDRTRSIAEGFAASDARIRYVPCETFLDAVGSHNRAFELISPASVYCKIVQADDWIYPECLERMVELAEAYPQVGVVSAYRLFGETVDLVGIPYQRTVVEGRDVLRQSLLGGPYVTGTPTSTLLRSSLLRKRQPFYEASFRHADTEAVYWALSQSSLGVVHQVLTYTRVRGGGETPFSTHINSYSPENLRMLVRYGPAVLSEREYRRRLRSELGAYVWWQAKQALRPSRLNDGAYRAYHREAVEALLAEAPENRELRLGAATMRVLLH